MATIEGFENTPERILTKDEVMKIISRFVENPTIVSELSNEQGLYSLEVKNQSDEKGEKIYQYMRKGQFGNQNRSTATVIHVVLYKDGEACTCYDTVNYNPETGEWVE